MANWAQVSHGKSGQDEITRSIPLVWIRLNRNAQGKGLWKEDEREYERGKKLANSYALCQQGLLVTVGVFISRE